MVKKPIITQKTRKKKCETCGERKLLRHFYKPEYATTESSICKVCLRKRDKERERINKKVRKGWQKERDKRGIFLNPLVLLGRVVDLDGNELEPGILKDIWFCGKFN